MKKSSIITFIISVFMLSSCGSTSIYEKDMRAGKDAIRDEDYKLAIEKLGIRIL